VTISTPHGVRRDPSRSITPPARPFRMLPVGRTRGSTHTLEIRPLGDGRVTVDAFVVLP
jgi:hypothetical protein